MVLQLMVYPIGFKMMYPVNYLKSVGALVWIITFDLLPSEDINKAYMEFTETEPYSAGLEILKNEGKNFALSAGTSLLIFLIMIGFIVIFGLIYLANKLC